jgi:phosphatidylglycerophosphate synthase
LTLAALPLALATGWFLWQAEWWWALAVGVFAAAVDFLDGAVARASGRATRFGGYLDSVVDRYSDAVFLFGIGLGLDRPEAWLAVAAGSVGAYGTSYARARVFEDVSASAVPSGHWRWAFERPERILLLGAGVLGQAVAEASGVSWDVLLWTVVVFAVVTNATVVVRVGRNRRLLNALK